MKNQQSLLILQNLTGLSKEEISLVLHEPTVNIEFKGTKARLLDTRDLFRECSYVLKNDEKEIFFNSTRFKLFSLFVQYRSELITETEYKREKEQVFLFRDKTINAAYREVFKTNIFKLNNYFKKKNKEMIIKRSGNNILIQEDKKSFKKELQLLLDIPREYTDTTLKNDRVYRDFINQINQTFFETDSFMSEVEECFIKGMEFVQKQFQEEEDYDLQSDFSLVIDKDFFILNDFVISSLYSDSNHVFNLELQGGELHYVLIKGFKKPLCMKCNQLTEEIFLDYFQN